MPKARRYLVLFLFFVDTFFLFFLCFVCVLAFFVRMCSGERGGEGEREREGQREREGER